MPRSTPFRLAAACALALFVSLSLAAGAVAKGFSADLRVLGKNGKTLAEKPVTTATTSVRADPKASCFGAGSGGSGDSVSIKGDTAMGLLARAAKSTGALRPLSITDSFDFGLAICGVGKGNVAKGTVSWYLKINHRSLPVSGDAAKVRPGDEVLWALVAADPKTFEYPDELSLVAPAEATAGVPFTVRAFSYDEKGKRTPAEGVTVTGAAAPTAADGTTTVTLTQPAKLAATKSGEIPSARVAVCIGGGCPGSK